MSQKMLRVTILYLQINIIMNILQCTDTPFECRMYVSDMYLCQILHDILMTHVSNFNMKKYNINKVI